MVDVKLLSKLCEAFGVPSEENEIAQLMKEEFHKRGYKTHIDRMGNVVALSPKAGKDPVMFGAHMDEIGLMVKFITDKGFIRFIKIGGIDNRVLLNQRVLIRTPEGQKLHGVVGHKPPHVQERGDSKVPKTKDLFIDIGAKSRKEVEKLGVRIGSPIGFEMPLEPLLNGRLSGKALDDRVGCYVLLQAAERLKNSNVALVGTVQEEVSWSGKGAMISAYHVRPRAFIAVDTSVAGDHPEISEEDVGGVALEKGPTIAVVEASGTGNVADRRLTEQVLALAKKEKISCQLEVVEGGGTDASTVYNVNGGIPSIAIGVPTRYIHSNVGVVAGKDIEKTIELVVKLGQAKLE